MRYLTFLVVAFALFVIALFAPLMAQQDIGDPSTPQTQILDVARSLGIADHIAVAPLVVRIHENGSQTRSVEARFRNKTGFRLAVLKSFLTKIEGDGSTFLISTMNFGQRDVGTDIWRPLTLTVRQWDSASKGPKHVSSLKHLNGFLDTVGTADVAAAGLTIDRLDLGEQAVTWDMRYTDPQTADTLQAVLKEKDAAFAVTRGRVTGKDGKLIESGIRWSRAQ